MFLDKSLRKKAISLVPFENSSFSKNPNGPFQITVFADSRIFLIFFIVLGPISRPITSSGIFLKLTGFSIERLSTLLEQIKSKGNNNSLLSILDNLISEDAVFYSPVVHTPQRGEKITKTYLKAASEVLFDNSFKSLRCNEDKFKLLIKPIT